MSAPSGRHAEMQAHARMNALMNRRTTFIRLNWNAYFPTFSTVAPRRGGLSREHRLERADIEAISVGHLYLTARHDAQQADGQTAFGRYPAAVRLSDHRRHSGG